MRFGYGLVSCERHPADERPAETIYREALELGRLADELGLDSIWTSEHHFVDSGYLPAPLTLAAAIGAVTTRISVGTAVALAPLYHPVALAEQAAVTDLLTGGRLILGLGLGWSKVEFAAFGLDRSMRGRAMDEILDIVRQAGADDVVRHHGPIYEVPEVSIRPKPARGRLRLWIGGSSEAALRRAAEHADGILLHAPLEEFTANVGFIRRELERLGRDPAAFEIGEYLTILPDPPGGDAWTEYRELARHAQWKYTDMGRSARRVGEPLPSRGDLDPEAEVLVRATTITGSPAEIAAQLERFRDVAGDDLHLVARNYLPGAGPALQRAFMERFASEVVPLLR